MLAQLAFAEHDEARVGNFLDDEVGRFYQVALPFVRHERGDVADHRRAMRQPERLVHVHRRRGGDVLDVDAFMNGDGPIRRHSIRQEQAADRVRRRDEAVDLPVFPPRERIALQVEVDAARRDERRRAAARRRAERQRDARHRDGVRIVRVDDVGLQPFDDAREPPRRREVHFGARGQRDELEPFLFHAAGAPPPAALTRAVALATENGNKWYAGQALRTLGRCYLAIADPENALSKAKEALALAENIGDRQAVCDPRRNAAAARRQGARRAPRGVQSPAVR